MKDIQNQADTRNIEIDLVGIQDITYPIEVRDRAKGAQYTNARISMSVNLPHNFKGTHMSRFVEILHSERKNISVQTLSSILYKMKEVLEAENAHIELNFKYFAEKSAPISGQKSIMDYDCTFSASLSPDGVDLIYSVKVPVMTLCPCSKEISEYGAHNQRSIVSISIRAKKLVWLEELIEYAEQSASAPLYALLKRQDEKFITEHSYENPVFVEDVVRNVTNLLMDDDRIVWFRVSSSNMESIHNHNAWAQITRDKRIQ